MQKGSVIQELIELVDAFLLEMKPFDSLMAKFFKYRRYIGSSDRRDISKSAYDILRSWEEIKILTEKITNNTARFYVIVYLVRHQKYDTKKIESIFNGSRHNPERLNDFERKFIEKINSLDVIFPENVRLNYPVWLESRLKNAFLENFEKEVESLNKRASVDLRVNTLKTNIDEVLKTLVDEGFAAHKTDVSPLCIRIDHGKIKSSHDVILKGYAEIQDEGSQIIAEICGASPGETVVDFCAGAGGKTLALASFMKNKGRIYATDKYEYRINKAKLRLRRAGAYNVYCNPVTSKWIKRHEKFADCVLVDAPCSGSGTWRRNPDMRVRLCENDIAELVQLQKELLNQACKLVKPNGRLVYATCSVFKDENEDQIAEFLENNEQFKLEKIIFLGNEIDFLKMSPYKNKTDGFFCSKLIRVS